MPAEDLNGERSSQGVPTGVDHSLDSLARDLANGSVSRRKALRLMGGVLLGGTLASIPGVAWAKPKPGRCTKNSQCPSGQGCCNSVCADLSTLTNCGTCGNACASGQSCVNGQCETVGCTPGTRDCCGTGNTTTICFQRADNTGTVCADGYDSCVGPSHVLQDCSGCAQYPGSVCVIENPGPDGGPCQLPNFGFACVHPAGC